MFSEKQRHELLRLARDSIADGFIRKATDLREYEEFGRKQGVFVTLTIDRELRGCIGFPEPIMPLNKAVIEAARAAAFDDPRFNPLKENEFTKILIEISVLTVPQIIKVRKPEDYAEEIEIGRDGLIIRAGPYSGLLLPQVPVEYAWDAETFLRHLCMKAGLAMDAWQNVNYRIFRFQAEVFSEEVKTEKVL